MVKLAIPSKWVGGVLRRSLVVPKQLKSLCKEEVIHFFFLFNSIYVNRHKVLYKKVSNTYSGCFSIEPLGLSFYLK